MRIIFLLLFLTFSFQNSFSQQLKEDQKKSLACINSALKTDGKDINYLLDFIKEYNKIKESGIESLLSTRSNAIDLIFNKTCIFVDNHLNIEFLNNCLILDPLYDNKNETEFIVLYEMASLIQDIKKEPSILYAIEPKTFIDALNTPFKDKIDKNKLNTILYFILIKGIENEEERHQEYIKTKTIMSFGDPEPSKIEYFSIVEKMPVYKLGDKAIEEFLIHKSKGEKGKVYVSFIVSDEGKVLEAEIARGINETLNQAALDIINNMTEWTPGEQRGKKVNIKFVKAVVFE